MAPIDASVVLRHLEQSAVKAKAAEEVANRVFDSLSDHPTFAEQRHHNSVLFTWLRHHKNATAGWTRLLCHFVTEKLPRKIRGQIYEFMEDDDDDDDDADDEDGDGEEGERGPNSTTNLYWYSEQVVREMTENFYLKVAWEICVGTSTGRETLAHLILKDNVDCIPAEHAIHITVICAQTYWNDYGGATGGCCCVLDTLYPKLNPNARLTLDLSSAFVATSQAIQLGTSEFWSILLLLMLRGIAVSVVTKLWNKHKLAHWTYEAPTQVPEFHDGDPDFMFRNRAKQQAWLAHDFAQKLVGLGWAKS